MNGLYGHDATHENVDRSQMIRQYGSRYDPCSRRWKNVSISKTGCRSSWKTGIYRPSIASNCAPVTQISIMYHEDGSFCDIPRLKEVPVHCFINPKLVLAAPVKYLWAGIGDAMAKHVESSWSAKAGEKLSFGSEFGITAGQMCFYPMVKDAKKAMDDAKAGRNSEELENTILNIVVSPGVVSVSVHPDYNGGIAHALFYGLTKREHIEKKHLHGEVVSYGTLVNLMVDKDWDKLKMAYGVNKSIDLPVCLADLELENG